MGNNAQCKVVGKVTIHINMHYGMIQTLTNARHIPNLKRRSLSLLAPLSLLGVNI